MPLILLRKNCFGHRVTEFPVDRSPRIKQVSGNDLCASVERAKDVAPMKLTVGEI